MADRYGVAATNYSSTGTWAATTGGASGQTVPTASDDVHLDANTPGDVTVDTASAARSVDLTGFTHILVMNATLTLGTSTANAGAFMFKGAAGASFSGTGTLALAGSYTTAQLNVTFNGMALTGPLSLNNTSASGGVVFTDTVNSSSSITTTRGKADFTGRTVTCTSFSGGTTLGRTVTFTNATVNASTGFNFSGSGYTLVTTSSTVNLSSGTLTLVNADTWPTINLTGASSTKTVAVSSTITNFGIAGIVKLTAGITLTTTTVTPTATALAHASFQSATASSTATVALGANQTLSNVDITDLTVTGNTLTVQDGASRRCSGVAATRTYQPAATGAGR